MRITVNLDTCAVTTTPAPFRLKAASIAQVEVQFTRASSPVPLPAASVIEFGLKAKGQSDSELLVYSNAFSATSGTLYAANVNCATVPLETALGIGDGDTTNDKAAVEFAGEVSWSIDGANAFRSQTFPVFVDAPVISSGAPALYMPPRYPVLDGNTLHFVRGDGTMAAAPVGGGITLPNPVNANVAYLGNGTWGLPNLAGYTGNIGNTEVHAGSIYATLFGNVGSETEMTANIYGNHFGDGSGLTMLNPNSLNSNAWNGVAIGSNDLPLDTITAWHFVGCGSPCFEGDGSGLTNLPGFDIAGAAILANSANFALNEFFANQTGGDIGFSNQPYNTVYAYSFVGDGSGLTNVSGGSTDLSSYTGNIGNWNAWAGTIYATSFVGDGSSMTAGYAYTSGGAALAQVAFNDFFTPTTNWTTMDLGQSGQSLGTVYANYFVGDGSGLSNVGGGTDLSAWGTPDIAGLGPVFGNQNGFYFDAQGNVGFAGHSAIATNVPNDFFPWYARQNQDFGESSLPLGTVYANSFVGDGSGLTNIGGSSDLSGYTGDIGNSGSRAGELYCQTLHSYDIHAEGSNVYAGRGIFSDYVVLPSLNYCPEAGGIYFNATTGEFYGCNGSEQVPFGGVPDLSTYSGNIGGIWSPVGNIYTTCIGDSDHWIPNIFSESIEAGTIYADEYFVCYPGMTLPSPAPCGTICYSRHNGGHFYGMTDDGWKQLDS